MDSQRSRQDNNDLLDTPDDASATLPKPSGGELCTIRKFDTFVRVAVED